MGIHVQQIVTIFECDWCARVTRFDDVRSDGVVRSMPQELHLWRRVRVESLSPQGDDAYQTVICPSCALRCTTAISGQRDLARREAETTADGHGRRTR